MLISIYSDFGRKSESAHEVKITGTGFFERVCCVTISVRHADRHCMAPSDLGHLTLELPAILYRTFTTMIPSGWSIIPIKLAPRRHALQQGSDPIKPTTSEL